MSKTIKLNKNQLVNLISESVNRIINESDYMDDGDLESVDDDYAYQKKAYKLCNEIKKGVYDNDLDGILSIGASEYFNIPTEYGFDDWVNDAASDRKRLIDRKYAFQHVDSDFEPTPDEMSQFKFWSNWHTQNLKDNPSHTKDILRDNDIWNEKENADRQKKYPNIYGMFGNGKIDKTLADRIKRDVYGTDQYDKRPLHKRGLNRFVK